MSRRRSSLASDKLAAADASDLAHRAESDERLRRQVRQAAAREKVHREAPRQAAAEQARRAQRKAGSVWHPSGRRRRMLCLRCYHGVAVSDETTLVANFAPVCASPIPPSGPIVVQTQRVKAQAPGRRRRPRVARRGAHAAGDGGAEAHGLGQSLHSAGSRGSMTSGVTAPRCRCRRRPPPRSRARGRGAAGAARPAGRRSGGRADARARAARRAPGRETRTVPRRRRPGRDRREEGASPARLCT